MFLFYTFGDVTESHGKAPQTPTKFQTATLERLRSGGNLRLSSVLAGACGRVIGPQEREVPCITIGLCNVGRYKCEATIIKAAGGVEQCLTP